jgi:glutamate 5-kinase
VTGGMEAKLAAAVGCARLGAQVRVVKASEEALGLALELTQREGGGGAVGTLIVASKQREG